MCAPGERSVPSPPFLPQSEDVQTHRLCDGLVHDGRLDCRSRLSVSATDLYVVNDVAVPASAANLPSLDFLPIVSAAGL